MLLFVRVLCDQATTMETSAKIEVPAKDRGITDVNA
jgi:hypothetical protein